MTNREQYKQAFSTLHTSKDFILEGKRMKQHKTHKMIAIAAACAMLVAGTSVAYAANVGNVQRTVQLWIAGDQTDVTIDFNADGSYAMEYLDRNGDLVSGGGGGVAFNDDGTERPLTPEELMEELMYPDVIYEDDGSVWVYYIDQAVEITDKFNDGICYVQIPDGDGTLYMTIKYQKGDAISPYKFVAPWEFN